MYKIFLLLFLSISYSFSNSIITPLPLDPNYNYKKALLGKKLFFDTRLSHDNTISCASCHLLKDGGDDNRPLSIGIDGKKGTRNAPTVLNARYNKLQFWDGSAKSLEEQINGPIHNPVEMASNFKEIISKLKKDEKYHKEFKDLYSDGITKSNITNAISEFEKALTTPESKFDNFLRGDKTALNSNELNGYQLFKDYGCISCHNGINIGGNLLQKIGTIEEYNTSDFGLYNITNNKEDKFYFKASSLRNVELTAPYFHDGSIKTLEAAVNIMIKHQVGFLIDEKEKNDIIKFLKTLTGKTPKFLRDNK